MSPWGVFLYLILLIWRLDALVANQAGRVFRQGEAAIRSGPPIEIKVSPWGIFSSSNPPPEPSYLIYPSLKATYTLFISASLALTLRTTGCLISRLDDYVFSPLLCLVFNNAWPFITHPYPFNLFPRPSLHLLSVMLYDVHSYTFPCPIRLIN